MEAINQFRESQIWKIMLPLALASDTLGLYTVIPEPVRKFTSIPLVSFALLFMFMVESGAELQNAAMVIGVFVLLHVMEHGMESLIQPSKPE